MNLGKFLKPTLGKIGITLLMPLLVGLFITQHLENTIEFYGYLLKLRTAFWTGEEIIYVFNKFVLIWIPFYVMACTLAHIIGKRVARVN